jgi:hypothetical protein
MVEIGGSQFIFAGDLDSGNNNNNEYNYSISFGGGGRPIHRHATMRRTEADVRQRLISLAATPPACLSPAEKTLAEVSWRLELLAECDFGGDDRIPALSE